MFFVFVLVLLCNLCNNFFAQYKHTGDYGHPTAAIYEGLHITFQAYGFIRISYGNTLENTEYGENDLIYGFHSRSTSQSKWPTANVGCSSCNLYMITSSFAIAL